MKKGLVFCGGGAKGSYEAGVWKYLDEHGIKFDIVTGTSIGGLNAAMYAQHDFDRDIELGDSLQIIERDFPQKCDSVVIGINLPHALSKDDYLRSFYLDADLQFYRLKKEIEDKQN